MAQLEKGAKSCREALMPELTEEELREADQELVRYRRQARSDRMLDSWRCWRGARRGLENVFLWSSWSLWTRCDAPFWLSD